MSQPIYSFKEMVDQVLRETHAMTDSEARTTAKASLNYMQVRYATRWLIRELQGRWYTTLTPERPTDTSLPYIIRNLPADMIEPMSAKLLNRAVSPIRWDGEVKVIPMMEFDRKYGEPASASTPLHLALRSMGDMDITMSTNPGTASPDVTLPWVSYMVDKTWDFEAPLILGELNGQGGWVKMPGAQAMAITNTVPVAGAGSLWVPLKGWDTLGGRGYKYVYPSGPTGDHYVAWSMRNETVSTTNRAGLSFGFYFRNGTDAANFAEAESIASVFVSEENPGGTKKYAVYVKAAGKINYYESQALHPSVVAPPYDRFEVDLRMNANGVPTLTVTANGTVILTEAVSTVVADRIVIWGGKQDSSGPTVQSTIDDITLRAGTTLHAPITPVPIPPSTVGLNGIQAKSTVAEMSNLEVSATVYVDPARTVIRKYKISGISATTKDIYTGAIYGVLGVGKSADSAGPIEILSNGASLGTIQTYERSLRFYSLCVAPYPLQSWELHTVFRRMPTLMVNDSDTTFHFPAILQEAMIQGAIERILRSKEDGDWQAAEKKRIEEENEYEAMTGADQVEEAQISVEDNFSYDEYF